MDNVYRKTERGQAEIATRQHKLAPRLRSALIVVDGKRSDLELASMLGSQPQETLQALLEAGFIELASAGVNHAAAAEPERERDVPLAAPDEVRPMPAYAPTEPLMLGDELLLEQTAPSARRRMTPVVAGGLAPPVRNIEDTKRHALQWLRDHLGTAATAATQRLERCQTTEALNSAILMARSVVEQQLGAELARRFETEMASALRRAVVQ